MDPITINELTETQKAYIAGFIDGEGTITIQYSKRKDASIVGRRGVCYRAFVTVVNTHFGVMEHLQKLTGLGAISKASYTCITHKEAYRWQIWSRQARQLLEAITPYLIVKKVQAEQVIMLNLAQQKTMGRKGVSEDDWAIQEKCYQITKNLNKRGA